jgi:molybdopterin synthase catalytic subunit
MNGSESMRGSEEARVSAWIVDGPIPPQETPFPAGAGAVLAFHGIVRPEEGGEKILGLDYQTYDPMAERLLRELAEEAVTRFRLRGFRVLHSRGFVPAGRPSLLAEAAGAHRRETLDALDWYITRMKEDVPIWKRPVPTPEAPGDAPHA